jgi:hypothetical protein
MRSRNCPREKSNVCSIVLEGYDRMQGLKKKMWQPRDADQRGYGTDILVTPFGPSPGYTRISDPVQRRYE